MLGGYQVIDFKGATLESATVIKGAFKKAKSGKALLVENLAGMSAFTHDSKPTNTTTAVCPVILVTEDTPTIVLLTITSEDSCSIVVPE